jgi:hypothetical protein
MRRPRPRPRNRRPVRPPRTASRAARCRRTTATRTGALQARRAQSGAGGGVNFLLGFSIASPRDGPWPDEDPKGRIEATVAASPWLSKPAASAAKISPLARRDLDASHVAPRRSPRRNPMQLVHRRRRPDARGLCGGWMRLAAAEVEADKAATTPSDAAVAPATGTTAQAEVQLAGTGLRSLRLSRHVGLRGVRQDGVRRRVRAGRRAGGSDLWETPRRRAAISVTGAVLGTDKVKHLAMTSFELKWGREDPHREPHPPRTRRSSSPTPRARGCAPPTTSCRRRRVSSARRPTSGRHGSWCIAPVGDQCSDAHPLRIGGEEPDRHGLRSGRLGRSPGHHSHRSSRRSRPSRPPAPTPCRC